MIEGLVLLQAEGREGMHLLKNVALCPSTSEQQLACGSLSSLWGCIDDYVA